jgi:uncharacterized protein YjbI with pentapeptide repeats
MGADLTNARLGGAHLNQANVASAKLIGVRLRAASLCQASLRDANLGGANLREAYLRETDLTGANLLGADLAGANLLDANLERASVGWTFFVNNDLSNTKGLETVQHEGPSTISIGTIYNSRGKIDEAFLRGAGIPKVFIEYIPALVAPGAIQFYSCFISYSTKDQEFADRLYADLQNKGVRCWFAPHDVQGGKKLHEQIDEAIRRYERLLLILSPHSMSSKWVKTEIRNARKREVVEKKRVLFPVRLASRARIWRPRFGNTTSPTSASGRAMICMCGSLRNCCAICGRMNPGR